MTGWTAVKAAGRDVSGWGQGERSLGHQRALRRSTWRRGGGGGGCGVVCGGGAGGVLKKARLGLRQGQFGQSVGGRGGEGERGGGVGER